MSAKLVFFSWDLLLLEHRYYVFLFDHGEEMNTLFVPEVES